MEITWRLITSADIPAWAALMAACEAVDRTGEFYDADDLHEELRNPFSGPDDRVAAWQADRMIGYAAVSVRPGTTGFQLLYAEGAVEPQSRRRGLGTRLLDWATERAEQIRLDTAPDVAAQVHVTGFLDNEPQVALLRSRGYEAVRWMAVMRVSLVDVAPIPPPAWPAGLTALPYDENWSRATREAHNEAFVDHWGFAPWNEQLWHQWVDGSRNFSPAASTVVVDDDDPNVVVGYAQTNEFAAFEASTGRREAYLAKLGVRREHRGRGLATALLTHSLRQYQAQGYAESSLDVDTANPTGAFGLYQRVGYRVEQRTAVFERVLTPGV